MKSVAKKRDKINKQALEDVSLLLKTAKEITFEKKQDPQTNGSTIMNDNPEMEKPIAAGGALKDVVSKFKNKLNKNRVFPAPAEGMETNAPQGQGSLKESKETPSPKEREVEEKKPEKEKKEVTEESESSSSNGSENSEAEQGFLNI